MVIKGTTAALRCGATHDPRISLRSAQAISNWGPLIFCKLVPGSRDREGGFREAGFLAQTPDGGNFRAWAPSSITRSPSPLRPYVLFTVRPAPLGGFNTAPPALPAKVNTLSVQHTCHRPVLNERKIQGDRIGFQQCLRWGPLILPGPRSFPSVSE